MVCQLKSNLPANLYRRPNGSFVSARPGAVGSDVYLLAGQSQILGRSNQRPGIDDDYSLIQGKVFQYGYNAQRIIPATNPLDHVNEVAGHMGLWLEFVKTLLPSLLAGRRILLVPVAQGDTSYRNGNWNPGDPQYNNMLARTAAAMASGTGNNILKAVLWMQGEGDSLAADLFRGRIQAMYDHMLVNMVGLSSATPFLVGSIVNTLSGSAVINASLEDFVNDNPAARFVDLRDLPLNADNIHYTAASLYTAGQRFGAALAS